MSELAETPLEPPVFLHSVEGSDPDEAVEDLEEAQLLRLTPEQADLVAQHAALPKLVMNEASRYFPISHIRDDIFSYLQLKLCRLATNYDPQRGASFPTYALPGLKYAVIDALRACERLEGRPRSLVAQYTKALREAEAEAQRTGRFIEPDKVLTIVTSLDSKISHDSDFSLIDTQPDLNPGPEELAESSAMMHHIMELVDDLPERTSQVVREYLGGLTLFEVGEKMGFTESRACQILRAARYQLGEELGMAETDYTEQALADKLLCDLLQSKTGTFSARPGADVVGRIINQTGVICERVIKVINQLQTDGYIKVEYTSSSKTSISKLRLTPSGQALKVVEVPVNEDFEQPTVPTQRVQPIEQTADDILAALSSQLSISNPA